MVLGDNDTKMSADLRERRDSMTMMARRNSATRVNDLILEWGGLAGLESAIGSPKGSGGGGGGSGRRIRMRSNIVIKEMIVSGGGG